MIFQYFWHLKKKVTEKILRENSPLVLISFISDIPDAPQNLEIHDVSSRSVRLTWDKPFDGNSPITEYTVVWRQANGTLHLIINIIFPK